MSFIIKHGSNPLELNHSRNGGGKWIILLLKLAIYCNICNPLVSGVLGATRLMLNIMIMVPQIQMPQALAFAIANERVKYGLGACEQLLGFAQGTASGDVWVFGILTSKCRKIHHLLWC